jgi:hypothetical protein
MLPSYGWLDCQWPCVQESNLRTIRTVPAMTLIVS